MNSSNQLTKLAIDQQLALGQIAKDLIEINRQVNYSRKQELDYHKTFLEAVYDGLKNLIKRL
jgi:hypothetical protein